MFENQRLMFSRGYGQGMDLGGGVLVGWVRRLGWEVIRMRKGVLWFRLVWKELTLKIHLSGQM